MSRLSKTVFAMMLVLFLMIGMGASKKARQAKPGPTVTDTSCVAVDNSQMGDGRMAGTLIDSNSAVFAAHYHPALGTTLRFRGVDGVLYSTTLVTGGTVAGTDIYVGNLSPSLPPVVHPAPIVSTAARESATQVNQFRQLVSCKITLASGAWVGWDVPMINMDSGSPILVNRNGVTCIVSTAKQAQLGPYLATYAPQIAALAQ